MHDNAQSECIMNAVNAVQNVPKITARHRSKPPVHWSLMSKADPRCCAKAAVDAPMVPTPGAPGGKDAEAHFLLDFVGMINPVINPKWYGFLNLVLDKVCKRHTVTCGFVRKRGSYAPNPLLHHHIGH